MSVLVVFGFFCTNCFIGWFPGGRFRCPIVSHAYYHVPCY